MKRGLAQFQKLGAWHLATRRWALLADEPGLGKTLQALMACELVGAKRVGVVCPASVVLGWREQIHAWMGPEWRERFTVGSYNRLVSHREEFQNMDVLIADEAHFCKTPESQRSQALLGNDGGAARSARYVWALTGTPAPNRPRELYPIMSTLAAPQLGRYQSRGAFEQRYCGAHFDGRGIDTRGATHVEELHKKLTNGFMLRRTVEDVLPQLPPAEPYNISFEMTAADRKWIDEAEAAIEDREEYISTVREDFSALGDNVTLMKAVGHAKVRFTVQFVKDKLETIDKIVVFAWHREVIERLEKALTMYNPATHRGGQTKLRKEQNRKAFMRDPECRILIANIGSAGTGLDGLQNSCSTGVFAEIVWGPGTVGQAVRRLRRIGMKERANIYFINARGSIEDAVFGSNEQKKRVIGRLVGAGGL